MRRSRARFSGNRSLLAPATLLGLALTLTACGGSDKSAHDPSPSVTTTATPSATPSPTASPSATPTALSSLEDRAQVKVARAWLAVTARDINGGRASIPGALPYETQRMARILPGLAKEDLGLHYPGPPPFTPVNVSVRKGTATVSACSWTEGWAQDRTTKAPTKAKKIEATSILLLRQGGRWKVDKWISDDFECGGVKVLGARW
jgi:hypothetical protein